MTEQETKQTTPLQNLFYYIRDLYNTSEPCYEFDKETGTVKIEGENYWAIEKLIHLAKHCEQKKLNDFSFAVGAKINIDDYILKVKRISIPAEPKIPFEISDWVSLNRSASLPLVILKRELEIVEKFEQSEKRSKDYEEFEKQSQNALFLLPHPSSLEGWMDLTNNKFIPKSEKKVRILFADNEKRVTAATSFQKDFAEYYSKYEIPLRTNKLYDSLHRLHYELKGKDTKRPYISFGLVSGKIGNQNYRNFLFNVPLKLSLKNQEITLETDTFSSKIFSEQYFTELFDTHFDNEHPSIIEQRKKEVLSLIDDFNSRQKEFLFDAEFIRNDFYFKALAMLAVFADKKDSFFTDEELNYEFDNPTITKEITLTFSPIIQTKLIESQIDISKDANNIINKINELQANGELNLIPDFFKKLFLIEGLDEQIKKGSAGNSTDVRERSPHISSNAHRSLFPLPYNEEQFEIAKRLNEQDAVTVKGPPGTGKSHTIANLISHFVAQGKSILVVSHNAKALSVLKDKLPGSIQDLAVSLVNEGKGNDSLKGSVNAIIRNLAQRYEESKVTELEVQLTMLEKRYGETLNELYKIVQANSKSFNVYNPLSRNLDEKTAYEWAVFFFEQSKHETEFIKDAVSYTTNTHGIVEKLDRLAILGNILKGEDFELIKFQFLPDGAFLDLSELRKIEIKLAEINEAIQVSDYSSIDPTVLNEKLKSQIEEFENIYEQFTVKSISKSIYGHSKFDKEILQTILEQNEHLRKQINSAEQNLLSFQLDLGELENTDPDILHQQINQLIVKFDDKNTLGWVHKSLLDKSLKRFFNCKVNFNSATDISHFKTIELEINKRKCLKQLSITFNNYLNTFNIRSDKEISEKLNELDFTIYFLKHLKDLNKVLKENRLPQVEINSTDVRAKLNFLKSIRHYADFRNITAFLKETKSQLTNQKNLHPLVNKIADAIENVDRSSYELYLGEYKALRDKQEYSFEFDKLFTETSNVLPLTANAVKHLCHSTNTFAINKETSEVDIFFLKINDFLTNITNQTKGSDKLLSDLQAIKRSVERQTADIISYKTWYHKSKKVSDTQKAALNAWLNDLINIGKGYGKNTARNIASAITNMQVAKGAVPIWIMPQETAVTFFPDATPEQFDLLIIDEASQCDISSLNLIFRCKKCLIVGDENQTSVVADRSIFTIERTNEMLDKYLISHRFKTQFDVNNKNNSIYTISGVIYPNIVTLTEHFRCLPEIIGYSNQYVYNYDIVPLKTATEKTYGEPISIHYVEDNHLDEQKPLIVQKVVEEIESYIRHYEDGSLKKLPTIGILTLDSSNTKHQTLLIKQISQSSLIRQYEDKLGWTGANATSIGTSRDFQGDERDIMFLTITASHSIVEKDNRFEIKPPRAATTEEYMRIFNVAASRAQEKSVVIHSIHPDAVGIMNPECYRKRLIDYYTNIQNKIFKQVSVRNLQTLLNKTDANSGDFEKSVCKFLYNSGLGNFLYPQFEVGKYCIDFGLIKDNNKLAIECDGFSYHSGILKIQEDINRQLILERAGWRFFRVQSTDWFYRNSHVSADLLNWIKENTLE